MNDLFRCLVMRPAQAVAPDDIDKLEESTIVHEFAHVSNNTPREGAINAAQQFILSEDAVRDVGTLNFGVAATAVADALMSGQVSAAEIRNVVESVGGGSAGDVAASEAFRMDRRRLADTLVSMKLLSSSSGMDGPNLVQLEHGYDAITRAVKRAGGRRISGCRIA